jgi:hypothetical protein
MARPDSLAWQTLVALESLLSSVRIANGWRTDLGAEISIEDDFASITNRTNPWLFIGMLDMPLNDQTQSRNLLSRTPTILFEFVMPASFRAAWKLAHNGLSDLIEVMPSSSEFLPDGVGKLVINSTQILRRPEGFPAIVAQVTARVNLVERKPAAQ